MCGGLKGHTGKDRTERRYIPAVVAVHLTWPAPLSSVSIEIRMDGESLNHVPVLAAPAGSSPAAGDSVLGASTLGSAGTSTLDSAGTSSLGSAGATAGAVGSSGLASVGFAMSNSIR
jgi:hypothetical protein